jgi:hypothetical protein
MPKGVYVRKEPSEKMKKSYEDLSIKKKGKRPYIMTDKIRKKISKGLMGKIPFNKGVQREDILKKVERYKLGLEIECVHHGLHKRWTFHSENNVKCTICAGEYQKIAKKKNPLKFLITYAKKHSKEQNRNFDIDVSDLENLMKIQNGFCALSGIEFSEEIRPSLDRIDSNLGYEKGNIQLVLHDINRMKSNFSIERFLYLCEKITEAKKGKK